MSEIIENPVRISLPSKGRLEVDTLDFLAACGLTVYKSNPRQYEARIPNLPGLVVLFQRPGDIVVSVRDGGVDFGISGLDLIAERGEGERGESRERILHLHDELGFGACRLQLAVPENLTAVTNLAQLKAYAAGLPAPLRVATKYPNLTGRFMDEAGIPYTFISAEGTLETAPSIGYADMISDLVSSGQTLRDNNLRPLPDAVILHSQTALIANKSALKNKPAALQMARQLLEYFEAYQRARDNLSVVANMRGSSGEAIARRLFTETSAGGLQGPTISRVYVREEDPNWYAIHLIVRRQNLFKVISDLRAIGGSGVVVSPVSYIFEEEPPRYTAMLKALAG